MTTEVAVVKLEIPIDLEHPFLAGGSAFKTTIANISETVDFVRGFWGIEDEDSTIIRVFVNWKSVSPDGSSASISQKLGALNYVESVETHYVDFAPAPPTKPLDPTTSGNTMVETIYFDEEFPHADGWVRNFNQKVENILNLRGTQFKAANGGWAKKKALAPGTLDRCLIWFAVVGWPSMQAHLEWRDSPEHHENTKLLEQYKDWWKGIVRVHSSMHEFGNVQPRV